MMEMEKQMNASLGVPTMSAPGMKLWNEMLSAKDGSPINPLLFEQYNLVTGSWPNNYDEIVIVVDENYEM